MRRWVNLASAGLAWCLLALAACGGSSSSTGRSPQGEARIRIASFDFPESILLAQLYGQVLQARGFPVAWALGVGPRELVEPALERGLVGFVPEYQGSALDFINLGKAVATADPEQTHQELAREFGQRGIAVLAAAPAQDTNAFVVTATTAAKYGLSEISDLRPVAPQLILGGPRECRTRPLCLPGLRERYELRFKAFRQLDASGPFTIAALQTGTADVALMFSTSGAIAPRGFVVLRDDRGLQPADNVTPVVAAGILRRFGYPMVQAVNSVSSALTTAELAGLNAEIGMGLTPSRVATDWLRKQGLLG